MEHYFTCPYCWQQISFLLESEEGLHKYTEDCEVCCRPIEVIFEISEGEIINFTAERSE